MKEKIDWDKFLRIQTEGRDEINADRYHHPYEPTPYRVLERLASSGLICKDDVVLDYGCGKGRVSFFLAEQIQAKMIGIEYDERIYHRVIENQRIAVSEKTEFILERAERYEVPADANRCYFFNPFSLEILRKVVARILESYYAYPREILLMFYYPSEEYLSYLIAANELEYYCEISCEDLFASNDPREKIVIFSLQQM